MAKPMVHAVSSARRFGGKPDDYLEIHQLMDSSKAVVADCRHRALTHNSWFICAGGPLERIFGVELTNSDGRKVSVRSVAEMHILEDFGGRFIPSAADYLTQMDLIEWMDRGKGTPPASAARLPGARKVKHESGGDGQVQRAEGSAAQGEGGAGSTGSTGV